MQPLVHEKKLINKLCHAFAAGALPRTHRVSPKCRHTSWIRVGERKGKMGREKIEEGKDPNLKVWLQLCSQLLL